jgi:hypothetical protein
MVSRCQNREASLEICNCTYEPCSRKGVCCECIRYHKGAGELPACFFSEKGERTYDRSVAHFVRENAR